ncbi:hypothetical protein H2200_005112 [Cladophialophora chaetospira]|uniref:Proline iminopeptidase n=1 Tax=Cladophialophora chaetospira TaxID=386627 RepID=A0AA39CJB5_9EURO|nr:hypothetical protein H2200_005112 [Cladophialophora chaetospira]
MVGYEQSEPWDVGRLPVDDVHTLHYEQYGKRNGKPVIFLHGGPGGETAPSNTAFFDPAVYRIVLFDQRGGGRSTPSAELQNNTSHHLVADIETLRNHLQISKWHLVFGGSWGSTLALLYSQTHPDRVGSLILRGIFLITKAEMEWAFSPRGPGPSRIFPEAFDEFIEFLPSAERNDPLTGYHKRLTSSDPGERLSAARAWNTWELKQSNLIATEEFLKKVDNDRWSLAHARIEAHYFKHGAWLEDGQLIQKKNVDRIRHIPSASTLDQTLPPLI